MNKQQLYAIEFKKSRSKFHLFAWSRAPYRPSYEHLVAVDRAKFALD
ncbi:hypothetical protein [Chitinimonas naiadis]